MTSLHRLARELRYRALPERVGRTVDLCSLADVELALRSLVAPWHVQPEDCDDVEANGPADEDAARRRVLPRIRRYRFA